MPVYVYVCKKCGAQAELDRLPKDGAKMRHVVEGRVCGTFRRLWQANFNRENIRAVRGEH